MSVDPAVRSQVFNLMEAVPERLKGKVKESPDEKLKQIGKILSQNPELKNDAEVVNRILKFTENAQTKEIKDFRRQFITDVVYKDEGNIRVIGAKTLLPDREMTAIIHTVPKNMGHFNEKSGVLTLSEGVLKTFDRDTFLKFFDDHKVKEIVIRQDDGQSISYRGEVKSRLYGVIRDDGLEPKELVKNVTVKLSKSGDEVKELKAKVLALWTPANVEEDTITLDDVSMEDFSDTLENAEYEPPIEEKIRKNDDETPRFR